MLPLKVWTWERESVERISSSVHCLEFYGWSPVTTFAIAERVKRTNITLKRYLYKQIEYASGIILNWWSAPAMVTQRDPTLWIGSLL